MKFSMVLMLIAAASLSACGKKADPVQMASEATFSTKDSLLRQPEGVWLAGNWQVTEEGDQAFKLKIDATNDTYTEEVFFQVGDEKDTEVPYPTVCHYRMSGLIRVDAETESTKSRFQDSGKKIVPELALRMLAQKHELIENPRNGAACATFIRRQQSKEAGIYTTSIKKIDDRSYQDAWYGMTYKKN